MDTKIASQKDNFPQWYIDVVLNAQLADYSPVKGCMVIRPRGYWIWERIQAELDRKFKECGHQNAYFPLLIPMSFMAKEAEHVEGFAPELAVVTHGGGEELQEPLCIRPTSETIIWSKYKDWIHSWRDLPLLYNQWCSVLRWEKRTRLFMRTAEFLWQEGHTAHETEAEAREETLKILSIYKDTVENYLCIPVVSGIKSDSEKFAGALATYSIEAMMKDKKALQAGTSHFLGQNFARAFDVQFQSREGGLEYVWATSWGVSTRLIGALVMTHGDDKGLVLPPTLAQEEVIIVPIFKSDNKAEILGHCDAIRQDLIQAGIRVKVDASDNVSPGWKFAEWEMRGVPVRIELGPKDILAGEVRMVSRDTGSKAQVKLEGLALAVKQELTDMAARLLAKAQLFREENTRSIAHLGDSEDFFGKASADPDDDGAIRGGFARGFWCGSATCEEKLKTSFKVTIRCLEEGSFEGRCCVCNEIAHQKAILARSY